MNKKQNINHTSPSLLEMLNSIDNVDTAPLLVKLNNNKNIDLTVKKTLTLDEINKFTEFVSNNVFSDNGEYLPSLYSVCKDLGVLKFYLIDEFNLVEQDEQDYNILTKLSYDTDLIEQIESVINKKQYEDLLNSMSKKIEFKKQLYLSTERQLLQKSIDEAERIYELYNNLLSQFNGIDIKDSFEMLKNISSKNESEIVNATLKYNKSKVKRG